VHHARSARRPAYAGLGPGRGVLLVARAGDGAEEVARTAGIVIRARRSVQDPASAAVPEAWVDAKAVAVDLRYHPARTPWLDLLRRAACARGGLGLLIEWPCSRRRSGTASPRNALEEAVGWTGAPCPAAPPRA
jgi:hypothetical protein